MSLGYADKLTPRTDLGGRLGDPEFYEDVSSITSKLDQLSTWVKDARKVFVFTGAGISTSCGIPDFRGPQGIWTLRRQNKPVTQLQTPFAVAMPSLTHQAIAALVNEGKISFVCSQNVDCLHLRSAIPRHKLAELHGNSFAERCERCKKEYIRDFEMETVGFKQTGRLCTQPGCGGALRDNVLDWDSALPVDEHKQSRKAAREADVTLVLGSSLQIIPANEIPLLTRKHGGKLVIVNLQETRINKRADMVLHAKVDEVMAMLMQRLNVTIPPYIRTDMLVVSHDAYTTRTPAALPCSTEEGRHGSSDHCASALSSSSQPSSSSWGFCLRVYSPHGLNCPTPMVESVEVTCCGKLGFCRTATLSGPPPFQLQVDDVPATEQIISCQLSVQLEQWANQRPAAIHHVIEHPCSGSGQCTASSQKTCEHAFPTQEVQYDAAQVVEAFLASPPEPVLPKAKKHKTSESTQTRSTVQPERRSERIARRGPQAIVEMESEDTDIDDSR